MQAYNALNSTDELLSLIAHHHLSTLKEKFPLRDRRILISLAGQLDRGLFLTENQSKILVKILKENTPAIKEVIPHIDQLLKSPSWSKEFRKIQRVRKLYKSIDAENQLVLEFSYDKRLKAKIFDVAKIIDGSIIALGPRHYGIDFTEKNIYQVVGKILNDDFEIEPKILDFYHEIEKIVKNKDLTFEIFSTTNENLKKVVVANVAQVTEENLVLLHDRRFRYQYQIFQKFEKKTLTDAIALRTDTKIFIDPAKVSLDEIFNSLNELNRSKILVVFDGHKAKDDRKFLDFLKKSSETVINGKEIGIYFRYDKEDDTVDFNKSIANWSFNKNLTSSTHVVGISNSKIPKFFYKTDWYPDTVISFTNHFKNNKAQAYCDSVDLTIYYSNVYPVTGVEVVSL